MRPLFVEFAGLPGAGKTTAGHKVIEMLQAKGLRCARRPRVQIAAGGPLRRRLRFLGFWVAQWRLVRAATMYALSIRPLRLSRLQYVEHFVFRAYFQRQHAASDFDIVVVDQSVVQTMWATAIYGGMPSRRRARDLLGSFYAAAGGSVVLITFDIDPATAAVRVGERGWAPNRFDNLPRGEVEELFSVQREMLRVIAEQAIETTGAPSIGIDGSKPTAIAASRIAAFLEVQVESRRCDRRADVPGEASSWVVTQTPRAEEARSAW